ncbi:hypothetical protein KUCAC02_028066, partial [Chaenocephalus aceratus]
YRTTAAVNSTALIFPALREGGEAINTAAGHRGPALVGHGALKANGGQIRHSCDLGGHEARRGQTEQTLREPNAGSQVLIQPKLHSPSEANQTTTERLREKGREGGKHGEELAQCVS